MRQLNSLRNFSLSIVVLLITYLPAIAGPLSGTYTVGGATANFFDLNAAINGPQGLVPNGVSGPVVFNILPGTWTTALWYQQVIPGTILGVSATNTITFQAQNGPGTTTISGVGASTANYIVKLNGCAYVTFKNLNLTNTNTTYGHVFELAGAASNNTITGCVLTSSTSSSSTLTGSNNAVVYANGLTGGSNTITSNTFNNGNIGVHIYGTSTAVLTANNIIDNNTFNHGTSTYYVGVYAYYTDNLKIRGNSMTKTGAGTYYGIYPNYCYNALEIRNNTITANAGVTAVMYGIYGQYLIGTPTQRQAVTGNIININTTTTIYGIACQYSNYDSISNNTINTVNTSGTTLPFYNYNSSYTAANGNFMMVTGNTINCVATSSGSYTFYPLLYTRHSAFSNNNVSMKSAGGSTTAYIGMYTDSITINNNIIYDSTTSSSLAFYLGYLDYNASTTAATKGTCLNNNIRLISTGSSITFYNIYYIPNAPVNNNTYYFYCTSMTGYYGYPTNSNGSTNNNTLTCNTTSSASTHYLGYGIVNGTTNNNVVTCTGAGAAVYISYQCQNHICKGNVVNITGTGNALIYAGYGTSGSNAPLLVDSNVFNATSTGSGTVYGSYGYNFNYTNITYSRNIVNAIGNTGSVYGLNWTYFNGKMYNNVINTNSNSTNYTFYLLYTYASSDMYNNVFNNNSPSTGTNYTIQSNYTSSYPGIATFRNNIISKTSANGFAPMWMTDGNFTKGDYNNIYTPGTTLVTSSSNPGASYTTLQAWRIASGQDKNSLTYNPGYINPLTDLRPDPTNSNSWSVQGRGVQIPGNSTDILGNARAVVTSTGVPDLGAYEFTPTATAPLAIATPAAAVAGSAQTFTFGQDTVAVINWDATSTVPASGAIAVKQYTGVQPISGFTTFNPTFMYFYDSIGVATGSGYNYSIKNYYKDPWIGTIAAEPSIHLAKKDIVGAGAWIGYPYTVSTANTSRNFINTIPTPTGFNNFGIFTGMDISNNAGVAGVAAPLGTFCPGTYTVKVNVANNGNNVINNVQIFWQVNGLPVVPNQINWTTPIPINNGIPGSNYATVTLGNINFGSGTVNLKVWTSLPNAIVDPIAADDTLGAPSGYPMHAALNGVYIVGGVTPDFTDVVTAATALQNYGICGPTTFNIRPGTYIGRVVLSPVAGMSSVNRVRFQSENGIASSVNINYTSLASADQSVIKYNNSSYFTFKNVSVTNAGTSSYCQGFELAGNPTNDSIIGCNVTCASTVVSSLTGPIYAYSPNIGGTADNNVIQNNTLTGGYWSIAWYGVTSSTATYTNNLVVENNICNSAGPYGIYVLYLNRPSIKNNFVRTTYPTPSYGIIMQNAYASPQVVGNNVSFVSSAALYVSTFYGANATTDRALIKNNLLIGGASTTYAGLFSAINNCDVFNNTIISNGSASNYAGYFSLGSTSYANNVVKNNVFAHMNGGYAIYMSDAPATYNNVYDYNDLYTNSTSIFSTGSYAVSNLTAWRAATGQDKNSVSYNPGVINPASNAAPDPSNPNSWALQGRGVHIPGNTKDIYNNNRVSLLKDGAPDIGAVEFEPTVAPPNCTAIPTTATPGAKQYFLFGADTVATVSWRSDLLLTAPLAVKQYSGRQAPGIVALSPNRNMWFYTDIKPLTSGSTYHFDADIYYKSIWMGTIQTETGLMVAEKSALYPWIIYANGSSGVTIARKMLSVADLTSFGSFTGIDTVATFSAFAHLGGSPIFCTGGSVTLFANTGNSYQYQWYKDGTGPSHMIPGATSSSYVATSGGDYTVEVTAPGPPVYTAVSLPISVTVVPPPMALINATGTLTYCTGTSLSLMASAGAISYQWQLNGSDITGPSGTQQNYTVGSAGSYRVKATNIGCTVTSSPTVVSPGPLVVELGPDIRGCEIKNQAYIVDAGHPGARYYWNTGDTTQAISIFKGTGIYKVVVDAGPGCVATDSVNVQIDPLPTVVGISYSKTSGNNYMFQPSGVQDATSYLWLFDDQGVITQNTTANPPVQHFTGSMKAKLIVCNSCGCDTTELFDWATNVGGTTAEETEMNLYPNPATDKVTLSVKGELTINSITVLNAIGEVVYKEEAGNVRSRDIDVSHYANGHYMIRANTNDGTISKPFNVIR